MTAATERRQPEAPAIWRQFAPMLLLCLVGALLYGHTLGVPFYLDDEFSLRQNPQVRELALALDGLFGRRGLSLFTLAVNYRLGGEELAGYHLVNIAIHLGAACVSLLLLRRVFPQRPGLALAGALIFVAHPLQTQGVTYTVQRMTSLSALFFLLAVYLFVRAREVLAAGGAIGGRRHLACYLGAAAAGGAAIMAKETAVVFPLAFLLFARLFLPADRGGWLHLVRYTAPSAILPAVAVIAYLLIPLMTGQGLESTGDSGQLRNMDGNSPLNYLATQFSVLWIYIRMLFLPYGQALDHGYPVARTLLTFKPLAGALGLAALGALAWQLRRRQPAIAGGIAWFFLALAVESSFIPLDPLFEHRLYLPMFGFAMVVPALAGMLPRPAWQAGLLVAVILVLALLTWRRNQLWNDPLAFFEDNARVTPHNERAFFNYGLELLKAGQYEEAERKLRKSIAMNPLPRFGYLALKELYLRQGRFDDAIALLRYALDYVDDRGLLYNELAMLYGKKGDYAAAVAAMQRAVAADPGNATAYLNLAQMALLAGDRDLAWNSLRRTLELRPDDAEAKVLFDKVGRR